MQPTDQPVPNPFEKLTAFLPLFWLSLAFLAGILFAQSAHASTLLWLLLAALAVLLALLVRLLLPRLRVPGFLHSSPASLFLVALSLTVFFLGAARYQASLPTVDSHYVAWYNDRDYALLVTGTLADPPDVRDTYTTCACR